MSTSSVFPSVPSTSYLRSLLEELGSREIADLALDSRATVHGLGLEALAILELKCRLATSMGLQTLPNTSTPNPTIYELVSDLLAARLALRSPIFTDACGADAAACSCRFVTDSAIQGQL